MGGQALDAAVGQAVGQAVQLCEQVRVPRRSAGSGRGAARPLRLPRQDPRPVLHLARALADCGIGRTFFAFCTLVLTRCVVVVVAPQLHAALSTKVLDVEVTAVTSGGFKNRSTVGLMVKGTTVDNIVVGGPAFACKTLCKGDTVRKVTPAQDPS